MKLKFIGTRTAYVPGLGANEDKEVEDLVAAQPYLDSGFWEVEQEQPATTEESTPITQEPQEQPAEVDVPPAETEATAPRKRKALKPEA